eukprot:UN03356
MLPGALTEHYKECLFYPINCDECNKKAILRKDMTCHMLRQCPMTRINCTQNCGATIFRKDKDSHVMNDCSETLIECTFRRFGCLERFKKKDKNKHIENATFTHMHLVQISDKVHELTHTNIKLHSRINVLESKQPNILDAVEGM